MCQVLGLSASGCYAWCRRSESAHAQRDRQLRVLVRASFAASKQRYGSPGIHEDLIEQDEPVSGKRVIRLMQEDGLKARARTRFKCTTMSDHDQPIAANLLDRQFTADAPNRRWVGDTTEFVIGASGKLYLAAILDLFSRFIVGWAVSAVDDRHLTLKALDMALKRRCPGGRLAASLRSRLHVCERSLSADAGCERDHVLDEPTRQLSRQCRHGIVLLVREERDRRSLRELRRSQDGVVRLHRSVL
jgi:transposase InsO family protein